MSTFDQLVAFGKEHPILAALYASLFTWGLTALGASLVFFFKNRLSAHSRFFCMFMYRANFLNVKRHYWEKFYQKQLCPYRSAEWPPFPRISGRHDLLFSGATPETRAV